MNKKEESNKTQSTPNNSFSPKIIYISYGKLRAKFNGNCFKTRY